MISALPASLRTRVFVRLLLMILFMHPGKLYSSQFERLPECPDKPNCVSSMSSSQKHYIAPIPYSGSAANAWRVLINTLMSLPRYKLIRQSDSYLHYEVTSLVFRFTDDLELLLDTANNEIQIRSGSRVGYGDFGVNRRRVEMIRKHFLQNIEIQLDNR